MNKKSDLPDCKFPTLSENLELGQRHDYSAYEKRSFKATAMSIGFSEEELRRLGRIYFGPARPEPLKKRERSD